jgi:hypothetical protein
VKRRQDEYIRRPVGVGHPFRRPFAGECDAPVQARRRYHSPDRSRRRRIAIERADAKEAPVEGVESPQRLDEHAMAFARDQAGDAQQGSGRATRVLAICCGLGSAGGDNGDPLRRHAITLDYRGRSAAWAEHAAKPRQQRSLQGRKPLRIPPRKAGLFRQRVMHQGEKL